MSPRSYFDNEPAPVTTPDNTPDTPVEAPASAPADAPAPDAADEPLPDVEPTAPPEEQPPMDFEAATERLVAEIGHFLGIARSRIEQLPPQAAGGFSAVLAEIGKILDS